MTSDRIVDRLSLGALLLSIYFAAGAVSGADGGSSGREAQDTNSQQGGIGTIRVTRDFLQSGAINPMQYGQFIEYLCNLVPSMWAEKLYDGSFEGLTPYNVAFIKETDFRERPWHPSGATARAEYRLDTNNPVSGKVCQQIVVSPGPACTAGIAQDGIAVSQKKTCTFRCWMRQKPPGSPVLVELRSGAKVIASAEFSPEADWKKFSTCLVPDETATDATLSISLHGPGTLWLDNASLMPDDAVDGWRPDVVEAVKRLHPAVIRFGGSALDAEGYGGFDWRDMIGDPDKRKPFRAWGGLQPTGPGLAEIVRFCRLVGAEPLICIRTAGKSPGDAAEQVEYFNGAADTQMGRLRASHGHPESYRIKFWQVGNERAGGDYEQQLPAFCRAIRAADPKALILSSFPTPGVLRRAGDLIDYVCPHQYDCANVPATQKELDATIAMCRQFAPQRPIKIAVTEWNTTAGDWGPHRAKLWTLENALSCARYQNLMHRYCDAVQIANRSNLANSFCSGIIQTDNHRLYKTPTYYMQQLYATLAGNRPLKIDPAASPDRVPDISATLAADGKTVILLAVNASLEDVTRRLDLSAFDDGPQDVETHTLRDHRHDAEPNAVNTFDEPERVAIDRATFHATSGEFEYRCPALSVSAILWRVKR